MFGKRFVRDPEILDGDIVTVEVVCVCDLSSVFATAPDLNKPKVGGVVSPMPTRCRLSGVHNRALTFP